MSHCGAVAGSRCVGPMYTTLPEQLAQIPNAGSSSEHMLKQHSSSVTGCRARAACSPVSGMLGSEI